MLGIAEASASANCQTTFGKSASGASPCSAIVAAKCASHLSRFSRSRQNNHAFAQNRQGDLGLLDSRASPSRWLFHLRSALFAGERRATSSESFLRRLAQAAAYSENGHDYDERYDRDD